MSRGLVRVWNGKNNESGVLNIGTDCARKEEGAEAPLLATKTIMTTKNHEKQRQSFLLCGSTAALQGVQIVWMIRKTITPMPIREATMMGIR